MTQEEKQLLLKDLCARLPYGVMAKCIDVHLIDNLSVAKTDIQCVDVTSVDVADGSVDFDTDYDLASTVIGNIRPYLRPMSSMTEKEKLDYIVLGDIKRYTNPQYAYLISEQLDYLNAHHFDYRGLIEKGLALEAPERMYMIE